VASALDMVFAKVWSACVRGSHAGRPVMVKLKHADFRQLGVTISNLDAKAERNQPQLARLVDETS
jgi:hypothetical protein